MYTLTLFASVSLSFPQCLHTMNFALMETEENHGWKLRKKLKWSIALMEPEEENKVENCIDAD